MWKTTESVSINSTVKDMRVKTADQVLVGGFYVYNGKKIKYYD